jgi:hypothetical protein
MVNNSRVGTMVIYCGNNGNLLCIIGRYANNQMYLVARVAVATETFVN